ncbi:hypothetical protein [Pantoea sp. JK]|uniref:hypothetical protein n=1 Tax=Pantoea sp. JK TaxID=2871703 RepID=UPI002238D679|nr:hypothetical protein [Pantoea sp. JK]MCW6030150.1 hypothetical protein [Pantoea sp. JK]
MKKAKIIKKIIGNFELSHLMCLAIGVMIPIYADTIFLLKIDSSLISAIMDTVTAVVAVMAAISVKDWLSDKVKSKAVDHATLCLRKTAEIKNSLNMLVSYTAAAYTSNVTDKNLLNKLSEELTNRFIHNMNSFFSITIEFDALRQWSLSIKRNQEENFKSYLKNIKELLDITNILIKDFSNMDIASRNKLWNEYNNLIHQKYQDMKKCHDKMTIPFDDFFEYIEK